MKTNFLFLLIFSIGFGLSVPFFLGGHNMISKLCDMPFVAFASITTLVGMTWFFNSARVFLIFQKKSETLNFSKIFLLILACEFSVKSTPAGIGGPLTAVAALKKEHIKPAVTIAAFSILFLLDVILFICIASFLLIGSINYWIEENLILTFFFPVLIILFIGISLFLLKIHYRRIVHAISRILYKAPSTRKIRYPLARQFVFLKNGWSTFIKLSSRRRNLIIANSVCFWLLQLSILYYCLLVTGVDISWSLVAVIQLFAMGAGRLTLLPAGSGGIEATAIGLLNLWVDTSSAAAAVLLWRSITLIPGLSAGAIALLLLGISLDKTKTASPKKPG